MAEKEREREKEGEKERELYRVVDRENVKSCSLSRL